MPVPLEGNCFVSDLREGDPYEGDGWREWARIGRDSGASAISLRVLELRPGRAIGWTNRDFEEVVYVLEGTGRVVVEGHGQRIAPDHGAHLPKDTRVTLWADADQESSLVVISSRCPEPAGAVVVRGPWPGDAGGPPARSHVAALADQPRKATADRWYCELIDVGWGSAVTQFVGAIPPGRAPDHYHEYEEVLCVLAGEGRMWAGERSTPIAPGSCIYLPRRQTHCVENTASGELRLLGVFYPAGSPAVRYKPGSEAVTPGS